MGMGPQTGAGWGKMLASTSGVVFSPQQKSYRFDSPEFSAEFMVVLVERCLTIGDTFVFSLNHEEGYCQDQKMIRNR